MLEANLLTSSSQRQDESSSLTYRTPPGCSGHSIVDGYASVVAEFLTCSDSSSRSCGIPVSGSCVGNIGTSALCAGVRPDEGTPVRNALVRKQTPHLRFIITSAGSGLNAACRRKRLESDKSSQASELKFSVEMECARGTSSAEKRACRH